MLGMTYGIVNVVILYDLISKYRDHINHGYSSINHKL